MGTEENVSIWTEVASAMNVGDLQSIKIEQIRVPKKVNPLRVISFATQSGVIKNLVRIFIWSSFLKLYIVARD